MRLAAALRCLLLLALGVAGLTWWAVPAAASEPAVTATAAATLPASFTYQGRLLSDAVAANGTYSMIFRLYDADSGGAQVGSDAGQTVSVTDGLFTVLLDFGAGAFTGEPRWLEIEVEGTVLAPRQPLTAAPYALYAPEAGAAASAQTMPWSGLTGVPAGLDDGDDDTTYTAGPGVLLAGTQLSADESYLQRRVSSSCAVGSSIRTIAADGTVTCESDDGSSYTIGSGLVLNAGQLSADETYLQRRVSSSCAAGSSISAIAADGTVTCEADDDTTYTAGSGLTLSGSQLSADTTFLQRRVSTGCAVGSSIRDIAADGTVTCESDDDTTYTAGTGLTLSGGQFSVDTALLQQRVNGTCAAGSSISSIAADGTVTCEADDDTTYTAGSGLTLSGSQLSADTTFLQRRVSTGCAVGSSIRDIAADGTVTCEADDDTTYTAGTGLTLSGSQFSVDTALLQQRVNGTCPAGSSISSVAADGTVTCESDDDTTYTAGTGLTLSGTQLSADETYLQRRVSSGCPAGSSINTIAADGTVTCEASGGGATGAAGGDLAGSYPSPSIATTPTAGSNIAAAVNASSAAIDTAHVLGDVEMLPAATQTATQATGNTGDLVDLELIGTDTLGVSGQSDLLSLGVSGTFNIEGSDVSRDVERFRVDNNGGLLAQGEVDLAGEFTGGMPVEGPGVRFLWLPHKAAIRAGSAETDLGGGLYAFDGQEIGLGSAAFGVDVRASGENTFTAGKRNRVFGLGAMGLGTFLTASGSSSVALGYHANTNARTGSFVFADRSIPDDGDTDFSEEDFRASVNNSFNVRATGGLYFYNNTAATTGLQLRGSSALSGSFVWSDRSSDTQVSPTGVNQTIFRSSGGYWLYSDAALTAGVYLAPGAGAWTTVSDRNLKERFSPVDGEEVLERLRSVPVTTWSYKTQDPSIRHMGPMAQDFHAAFGLDDTDKGITTADIDGVMLAGVKALDSRTSDQQSRIEALERENASLRERLERLEQAIEQLRGSGG